MIKKKNRDFDPRELADLQQYGRVIGIDEAGRGCLAGPVVAAAVALPPEARDFSLYDSKQLSLQEREKAFDEILAQAVSVGIGIVPAEDIDKLNILGATLLAMNTAAEQIEPFPQHCFIDGNRYKGDLNVTTVVKGDALCRSIAAASIIAKVTRDRIMEDLHTEYPNYGFADNKGYPTPAHKQAVRTFGITPEHRISFLNFLRKEQQLTLL